MSGGVASEVRTFCLLFVTDAGEGFVAVVDVSAEAAAAVEAEMPTRRGEAWALAAVAQAWRQGCNPGGEVTVEELSPSQQMSVLPRGRLFSMAQMEKISRACLN